MLTPGAGALETGFRPSPAALGNMAHDVLSTLPARCPTILVVEDEVLIRMSLAWHLRDQGFPVLEAAHAEEAMAILASVVAVDVLLTDVHLPGAMNGFALARWAQAQRPGLRVIITSGTPRLEHGVADHCEETPYLLKPYDPTRLVAELRRIAGPVDS